MATPTIKTTYALDQETVRALEEMARRWGVSKSEALRRAIRAAAVLPAGGAPPPLDALDRLQRAAGLTTAEGGAWARKARSERQASSVQRERTR